MNRSHVLYRVSDFIARYLHCTSQERIVLALYTLHTYLAEVQHITPYLWVRSPVRRCGKTTLLELLELLCLQSVMVGARITAASLARVVEKWHPTLLIDECGKLLRGDQRVAETLTGILDMGYRASGHTLVMKDRTEPQKLACFCPKVIAGLGTLPDTLVDRSIPILLERAKAGEAQEFFRDEVETEAKELREALQKEADNIREEVKEHRRPFYWPSLNSRQRDVCRALFAIADVTGVWITESRDAIEQIFSGALDAQEPDDGEALLADIRDVFDNRPFLKSEQLVQALHDIEGGPWEFMSKNKLARMMKQFGIRPAPYHVQGTRRDTQRGYERRSFIPAWNRFLSTQSNRNAVCDTKEDTSIITVATRDECPAEMLEAIRNMPPARPIPLHADGSPKWEKPQHWQAWPKPPAARLLVN